MSLKIFVQKCDNCNSVIHIKYMRHSTPKSRKPNEHVNGFYFKIII